MATCLVHLDGTSHSQLVVCYLILQSVSQLLPSHLGHCMTQLRLHTASWQVSLGTRPQCHISRVHTGTATRNTITLSSYEVLVIHSTGGVPSCAVIDNFSGSMRIVGPLSFFSPANLFLSFGLTLQ